MSKEFKDLYELCNFLRDNVDRFPLLNFILKSGFDIEYGKINFPPIDFPPFIAEIIDERTEHQYLITDIHDSRGEVSNIQVMQLYNVHTGKWFNIQYNKYYEVS